MSVLAEIRWCETHGTNTSGLPDRCRHMDYGNDCVVVDAEVTAKIPSADDVFGILADDPGPISGGYRGTNYVGDQREDV